MHDRGVKRHVQQQVTRNERAEAQPRVFWCTIINYDDRVWVCDKMTAMHIIVRLENTEHCLLFVQNDPSDVSMK